MRRRVIGGIAGWIIGALPLIAVNIATYMGFYTDNPILIGATALLAGLILGGITSGFIGGRPQARASGGAIGAGISGGISAVLYALSIIALVILAPSLGSLPPSFTADQVVHIIIAVLFCAALLLGISMLAGVFAGRGQAEEEEETLSMPVSRTSPYYHNQPSKPSPPNRMYNNPQTPSWPSEVSTRWDEGRSQPNPTSRSEGYRGYEQLEGQGESYDDRRYQAAKPGRSSRPRHSDRDLRSW
jgi:hypothetical protein